MKHIRKNWIKRITRKALDHGVSLSHEQAQNAADLTIRNINRPMPDNRWAKFEGTDNLPGRTTVRQYMKGKSPKRWFGSDAQEDFLENWIINDSEGNSLGYYELPDGSRCAPLTRKAVWVSQSYMIPSAYYSIPYTCQGYEQDSVLVANYRYLHEAYADLFKHGLLVDHDSCVFVMIDKPYHDEYRLESFMDEVAQLKDYCCFDDELISEVEREWQKATVKDEINSFVRHLEMDKTIEALLIPKSQDWRETFDWDKALLTQEVVERHIWSLICDHEIEFDDNGTYIDIEKVAKLSPLYHLGTAETEKITDAIYEVTYKIDTYATQYPQLRFLMSCLNNDLLTAAEQGESPAQAFY